MAEMANNPQFVFNSRGGGGGGGGSGGGGGGVSDDPNTDPNGTVRSEQPPIMVPTATTSSKIKQRRATIFAHKPVTIADQYRDLLDNAMYTPRRRVILSIILFVREINFLFFIFMFVSRGPCSIGFNLRMTTRTRTISTRPLVVARGRLAISERPARASPKRRMDTIQDNEKNLWSLKFLNSQTTEVSKALKNLTNNIPICNYCNFILETTPKHVPKPKVVKQNDDDNSQNNNNPTAVKHPFVHFSDENFTLKAKDNENEGDQARQPNQQPANGSTVAAAAVVADQIGDEDLNEQEELQF